VDPEEAPRAVRLRIDLAYDGSGFSGWAAQPGRRTVEETLAVALGRALRLPAAPGLTVAGRTDAGVHARGQVVHADVPAPAWTTLTGAPPPDSSAHPAPLASPTPLAEPAPPASSTPPTSPASLTSPRPSAPLTRLAAALPPDVRVHAVGPAPDGFDARFSALWRRYSYRVCDDPARADPLRRHETLWTPRRLDLAAMNEAAASLTGEHDFAAFCRRREGATTVRTLRVLDWQRDSADHGHTAEDGPGLAVATVVADAFCHNMVRALVGALLAVGEGRRPPGWPAEVLAAAVRDSAVRVVPPHGLCLEEVGYPEPAELATRAAQTRNRRTATASRSASGC
jgi:tRNA pseudouridine38-40 synthase